MEAAHYAQKKCLSGGAFRVSSSGRSVSGRFDVLFAVSPVLPLTFAKKTKPVRQHLMRWRFLWAELVGLHEMLFDTGLKT